MHMLNARKIFWSRVKKAGENECWLWLGAENGNGYGRVALGKKLWLAHRAAYLLEVGPIPSGLSVLHNCDKRWCVNPRHLRLGTQKDNIQEASRKNRLNRRLYE